MGRARPKRRRARRMRREDFVVPQKRDTTFAIAVDSSGKLTKLRERFGIKRLLLERGGETNGSFLRAGLVDELSLLLTPVADMVWVRYNVRSAGRRHTGA